MTSFVSIPLETDAAAIESDVYDALADRFPGWEPSPGNLEVFLVKALALMASDLADVAVDVPGEIFAQFGARIVNVPPFLAESATTTSTWTMVDNAGYTIPQGTQVSIAAAGDDLIAFEVMESVTVPPGSTATQTGEVALSAVVPGAAGNGLTNDPQLIDALAFVSSITSEAETAGGQDAEDPDAYLDRLAAEMTLLTPRPILPGDVEVLARRIEEVHRAVAIDGYNPADSTTDNERMVALAVVKEDGEAVSAGGKTELDDLLESMREVTFIFNVIDPNYQEIAVTTTFSVLAGYDTATVEADVAAALSDYLSPANWGTSPETSTDWRNVTVVRYTELIALVDSIPGVDYVATLQLAKEGDPLGTADVTLDDPAPLTRPGTIDASSV